MTRITASGVALALVFAACTTGTTPPTGSPGGQTPGGATPPGSATPPPAAPFPPGPTADPGTQPTPGAGGPSASLAFPTFDIPSFAPDTTLEAAFPAEIDGEPVTDIESASFLTLLESFETDQATIDAFVAAMQGIGVDPATVSFASGTATVGGEELSIQALRAPGGSGATAIDVLIRLDPPEVPPVLINETVGGKSVTVATVGDDDEEFYYASGEFAWFLPGADRAQAEIIFQALP